MSELLDQQSQREIDESLAGGLDPWDGFVPSHANTLTRTRFDGVHRG